MPERFGPYVVLGSLGSGGMGAVYRALDTRLEREVAVKVLHRNLEVSRARERFLREARTVSSLNHPNICTVFDIGEQDGDPYLVMELLQGEPLKDRIARGPIPEGDIREIAFRVALALQAAHAKGVVHRDIKPANLFLVSDGQGAADVKVLDFGLAKLESDGNSETRGLTRAGATVGTVEYMSPEQACGEALDVRSDLFSLGAVLYEMATGQLPFRGATSAIVFSELLNRDPVPPREANLNLATDLDRIIRALLIKPRNGRVQSAGALLDALAGEPEEVWKPEPAADLPIPEPHVRSSESARPVAPPPLPKPVLPAAPAFQADPVAPTPDLPVPPLEPARAESRPAPVERAVSSASAAALPPLKLPVVDSVESRLVIPGSRTGAAVATSSVERDTWRRTDATGEQDRVADPVPANYRRTGELPHSRVHTVIEDIVPALTAEDGALPRRRRFRLWPVLLLVLAAAGAAVWYAVHTHAFGGRGSTGSFQGAVQILPVLNQTGNASLDRAPTELVELLLQESPTLTVRAPAPMDMLEGGSEGSNAQTRAAAEAGPLATLSGFVSHTNDGFLVHLALQQAADGIELASVEDTFHSVPELPAGIATLVAQLREKLGESSASSGDSGQLASATDNLAALAALGEAEARLEMADDAAALHAYAQALQLAPGFVAARLGQAALLQRLHADAEAGTALDQIAATEPAGGPHLRALRNYLLAVRKADGSALTLAEQWHGERPADSIAAAAYVDELLRVGREPEAEQVATAAVATDPYRLRTQRVLTRAQIAAGHADAAWQSQTRAFNLGLGSPDLSLAAAYLKGDAGQIGSALNSLRGGKSSPAMHLAEATFRANTGDIDGARTAWDAAAASAAQLTGAVSLARYMRAVRDWNLALAGTCGTPLAEQPAAGGDTALLEALRASWCHQPPPPGAAAASAPLIAAAGIWAGGDLGGALAALDGARATGPATLAALLRGRLHLLLRQPDAAVSDFRAVLSQRGTAYLSHSIAYPAALAQQSAVYRSMGDLPNAAAQQALLEAVWKGSASTRAMVQAASVHP